MTRVTWNGREVQNPILRVLVAKLAIVSGILAIVVVVVTLPITLPLDLVLKAFGRRGFRRPKVTGDYEYMLDAKAFQKRS